MRIQKKLSWLGQYIAIAAPIIPKVEYIILVREIFHQKNKIQRIHASLTQECIFGTYVLSLYTGCVRCVPNSSKTLYEPYSKIDILNTLAHELAHLDHWQHTPEHKILESKLTVHFMRHLLKSGYISEEEEFSGKRRKGL